jgi:hypothetical protein
MKRKFGTVRWLLAGMLFATSASAEQYDFEVGLDFDSTQFDGSQTIATTGGTVFNSNETDTDDLLTSDITLSGFVDESVDATGWRLGVGKYVLETTTIGL